MKNNFVLGMFVGAAIAVAVFVLVNPERELAVRVEEVVLDRQGIMERGDGLEDLARLSEATKMFTKIQEKMLNLYNPVLNKDLKEETPGEVAALFLEYSKYCPINPLSWTDEKGSHYRCRDTEAEIEAIIMAEKIKNHTRYPLVNGEIIIQPVIDDTDIIGRTKIDYSGLSISTSGVELRIDKGPEHFTDIYTLNCEEHGRTPRSWVDKGVYHFECKE